MERRGKLLLVGSVVPVIAVSIFTLSSVVANAKDKVTIAYISSLTGSNSHLGIGGRNSADLAVRLRNADPKAKYTYELVSLDDECKPNIGVQAVTKIGSDPKVSAAIAHYCSAVAMATIGVFNKFGLPMITFTAIAPEITEGGYKEVNRIIGNATDQTRVGASFMAKLGYKTFGVIHDTTAYGTSLDKQFDQFVNAAGGKVVAKFGTPPEQQDFTAELTKLKEANPQVIYLESLAPLAIRVRLQMDKLGITSQLDSVSGVFSDDYIKTLGPLAEGTLSRRIGKPIEEIPDGQNFLKKYAEQKYDHAPDVWGHYAYAEANLLMDVIEQVGPDRSKISDALRKVKDHDTLLGPVTFDGKGQNINDTADVIIVQDGKWITYDSSEYAKGKRKLKRRDG
jgi:branched-chain amino acid transport system substrate-binding protein